MPIRRRGAAVPCGSDDYGGAGGSVGGDDDRMFDSTVNVSPLVATATAV
jgi:hypothetical protein